MENTSIYPPNPKISQKNTNLKKKIFKFILTIFIIDLFLFIIYYWLISRTETLPDNSNSLTQDIIQMIQTAEAKNKRKIIEGKKNPTIGNVNAGLTIVEFIDFNNQDCQESFFIIKNILDKYPDKIRLIVRFLPSPNELSLNSAIAATCANEQNKFWDYHDQLFIKNNSLTNDLLVETAKNLNLDQETFTTCVINRSTQNLITNDQKLAKNQKITKAPWFFINGVPFNEIIAQDVWEDLILNFYQGVDAK